MTQILQLIEGDPLSLLVALALFAYVGNWAVGRQPQSRSWGWRLALVAFVGYVGYAISRDGLTDPGLLASAAFRGLLASGLLLGTSWIVLSLFTFVYEGTARAAADRARQRSRRRDERQWELERQRSEQQRWSAERERSEREARAREEREQTSLKQQQDLKRREDARLRCQMLYDRHQTALSPHFSRDQLAEYFTTFLSNEKSPEAVEERARMLETMLQQTLETASRNGRKFQSMQEIAEYFQARRDELDHLGYATDVKESLATSITEQEDRAIQEFMKP